MKHQPLQMRNIASQIRNAGVAVSAAWSISSMSSWGSRMGPALAGPMRHPNSSLVVAQFDQREEPSLRTNTTCGCPGVFSARWGEPEGGGLEVSHG